jgi:hypothetical protein
MHVQRKVKWKSLKAFEVWDKPNLNDIFKSYLAYHNLKILCISLDYLDSL